MLIKINEILRLDEDLASKPYSLVLSGHEK